MAPFISALACLLFQFIQNAKLFSIITVTFWKPVPIKFLIHIFDGPVKLKNTAEFKCLSKKPHTPGHPAEQYGITLHFWCTSHSQMPCC